MSKKPRIPESAILKACLASLSAAGVFHHRNNTGAQVSEYKGRKRFIRYGVKGAPDIVCVHKGRYIGVEVKAKDGKLSDDQYKFGMALEAAGGVYLIVRTLEDAAGLGQWVKSNGSGT